MKNYGRNFFSFSEDNFFDHPFKFTTIKRTNPDMKDLNDNFKGKRELGMIAGVLSLKYGK